MAEFSRNHGGKAAGTSERSYKIYKTGSGVNTPKKFRECRECGRQTREYRVVIDDRIICMDCIIAGYLRQRNRILKFISFCFRIGSNLRPRLDYQRQEKGGPNREASLETAAGQAAEA
jgi:hypothetical protein